MSGYFIEYRFQGKAKTEIKSIFADVNQKFRLKPQKHFVAHISLATPRNTRSEKKLIRTFVDLCSQQSIMEFKLQGFQKFEGRKAGRKLLWFTINRQINRVVAIHITPDKSLDKFRWELCCKLKNFCGLMPYDIERNCRFHCSIAMHLPASKHQIVYDYVRSRYHLDYRQCVMRATLLKGQRILCEYDFFLKRRLTREEALAPAIYRQSCEALKRYVSSKHSHNEEQANSPGNKDGKSGRIFFTSDQHFDHSNIIEYCHRPFRDVKKMNSFILHNWNKIIDKDDEVFCLGDMSFRTEYWFRFLKGTITFINGNHGTYRFGVHDLKWEYNDFSFYLIHNPAEIAANWDGWVIHGHKHNNDIVNYPFFDRKTKRFNVCVELTDYKPVAIDDLVKIINSGLDRLEYWDDTAKRHLTN